ncbi:MAG: ribulose-phosphate 3-epimerase, partial [Ruminiclostridium sp.]|nr:ribulose-phosphate 3-epimerase [Ruminiclostridium sp.]
IAVKPATPASAIVPYIGKADMVLVMTVEPGYGGQGFISGMTDKIREIRALDPDKDIEVDGGINGETVKLVREAGANVLVAGTYLFRSDDMTAAVKSLLG